MRLGTFKFVGRCVWQCCLVLVVVAGLFCSVESASAQVIRVDVDSTTNGPGSTWANAFDNLVDALDFAYNNNITEIWVAEGTYKPDVNDPGNRSLTFDLHENISEPLNVFGGFDGTETLVGDRNPGVNITILSGDLDGDDGANFTNRSDNSYHVMSVYKVGDLVIDGFTIRGGQADDSGTSTGGGAQISHDIGGSLGPLFSRCKFTDNYARRGGGIGASTNVVVYMRNCTVTGNKAVTGGGIYASSASGSRLRNCIISSNSAETGGGGYDLSLMLNCSLVNNTATNGSGGGVYTEDCDFRSSYFADNVASCNGGGLYMANDGAVQLTNCAFVNNEAQGSSCNGVGGGGVRAKEGQNYQLYVWRKLR